MNKPIKVMIADDHPYIIQALSATLLTQQNISIVGTAINGEETLSLAKKLAPDVIFMDIRMPRLNGIEVTEQLRESKLGTRVICITGFDDEKDLIAMLQAGAKGFILKTSETGEILRALEKVTAGEEYYCKDAITIMIRRFIKNTPSIPQSLKFEGFSRKELQIINLICRQKTSKEISEAVFLGEKTINYYRQRILEKMQVKSSIGIVVYAIKNNMVNINELF